MNMRNCKSFPQQLTVLALAVFLSEMSPNALAAATMVSKKEAATIATQAHPGKIEHENLTTLPSGQSAYRIQVRTTQGSVATVVVDARTGEVLNGGAMADPAGSAPAQLGTRMPSQ